MGITGVRIDGEIIDQPEVIDVDGNLWIIDCLEDINDRTFYNPCGDFYVSE